MRILIVNNFATMDDGHWPGEDALSQDVHVTPKAVRALWVIGKANAEG